VVLVRGLGVISRDWIAGVTHGPIAVYWPLGAAPNEVTLSESGDGLVRHLHDGDSVRLELPDGLTGPARILSIRAGAAPSLEPMDVPAPSLPVMR